MQYPFSGLEASKNASANQDTERAEFSVISEATPEQRNDIKQLPTPRQRIKLAESDLENLHKITHLLIYTSGFLLTICLGAIYFSYSNNSSAHLPLMTKVLLFIAVILLSATVLVSAHTLHLSPRVSLGNVELADMLEKRCDDEKWCTDWASLILQLAIIALLAGILIFAADRFFKSPNVISDLENTTHLRITITHCA